MSLYEREINQEALKEIQTNIQKKSPYPEKVIIIAVTKNLSFKSIEQATNNKINHIGENKIQELKEKTTNKEKPKNLKIHFIGHLQTNKAKKAIELCDYIQSVDSTRLAKTINKQAKKLSKIQKIYLQINIGKDSNKQGFHTKDLAAGCQEILHLKNIEVAGIMTILPQNISHQQTKALYLKTKQTQVKVKKKYFSKCNQLSMGMSEDYETALECGATNIRIGTKLYGKRK